MQSKRIHAARGSKKGRLSIHATQEQSRCAIVAASAFTMVRLETGANPRPAQTDVAQRLRTSSGSSFGHPEGFGLPLAEAAACGCALIGYSGLGGRELMTMARSQQVGWEVEFGDWQGFLHATEALIRAVNEQPQTVISHLQALSDQVRQKYSWTAMVDSVGNALPRWESQLPV